MRTFCGRDRRLYVGVASIALLLIVVSWLPQMLTLNPGVSYGDEGLIAQAAKRVVNGQWPFRDFFSGAPPGAAWWYGLFLLIFGETFLALRIGVLATALLIMLATLWALSRLTPCNLRPTLMIISYLAFFGGPYWFVASLHWVSLLFCLLGLALLLPAPEANVPSLQRVFWAGVTTACAVLALQHKGGLWLLTATFALATAPRGHAWRLIARFWTGILVIIIPVTILFISVVGWDRLVYQLLTFPLTRYHLVPGHRGVTIFADLWVNWQNVSSAWPASGSGVTGWLQFLTWNLGFLGRTLVHLFPFVGGVALGWLWIRRAQPRLTLALLTAFFVASYLATLHRFHETTLVFAAPAAVLVLAVWVGELQPGRYKSAVSAFSWLWITAFFSMAAGFMSIELLPGKVTSHMPAGAVDSLYPAEAEELAGVEAFLRQQRRPGDQIVCLSYLAMFYYLLDVENPTPYDLLTYPINTPEQFDEVQSILDKTHARWVLMDHYSVAGVGLGPYLLRNYQIRERIGKLKILERRPSPGAPG